MTSSTKLFTILLQRLYQRAAIPVEKNFSAATAITEIFVTVVIIWTFEISSEALLPAILGTPCETFPGERRVALTPRHAEALRKAGIEVLIEHQAGVASGYTDDAYIARGAQMVDRQTLFTNSTLIAQVRALGANPDAGRADLGFCCSRPSGGGFWRATNCGKGSNRFSSERRFVFCDGVDAAHHTCAEHGRPFFYGHHFRLPGRSDGCIANCRKMFPMLMTAAGTVAPAKVFVLGAGVAGLQAIATARRLGAVVSHTMFDPVVKEQVESVGGKFIILGCGFENVRR